MIKLGLLAGTLLSIFFLFTQCTRFAVHFSFCINTRGQSCMKRGIAGNLPGPSWMHAAWSDIDTSWDRSSEFCC